MTIYEIAVEAEGLADPRIIGEAAKNVVEEDPDKDCLIWLFGDDNKLSEYAVPNRIVINHSPYFPNEKDKEKIKKERLGSSLEGALEFAKKKNIPALCLADTRITKYVMMREKYILKGIKKPTVIGEMPTKQGFNLLTDVGLNPHLEYRFTPYNVKPKDLIDFGLMAATYLYCLGQEPTIGFASFNEKYGNKIARKAKSDLKKIPNNGWFKIHSGFFRGDDLFEGNAKVITCEADRGNFDLTALEKYSELLESLGITIPGKFSQDNYGAMPILGTFPNIFLGHRKSGLKKIENAIQRTLSFCEIKDTLNQKLVENLNY